VSLVFSARLNTDVCEPLAIRVAVAGDAEALSRLARRSKGHWGYSDAFLEACRAELAVTEADCIDGSVFVAESGGRLRGFYGLKRLTGDTVDLDALYVAPGMLGQGFGRRLLQHAMCRAHCDGFRSLMIQADPHAAGFYTRCGAMQVGHRPSGSIPGRDLPLFRIDLTGDEGRARPRDGGTPAVS